MAEKDAPPTVNELISSSRKSTLTSGTQVTTFQTPSLPPQIRHLLSQPELPTPRVRPSRRIDANGRPLPAGPPPPRSWLQRSRYAPDSMRTRGDERVYPSDLHHLPGLKETGGKTLQDMCMRQMARNWEYLRAYEQNNLAELPTRVRMELLSFIAVDGPDDGVGFEGLKNILLPPDQWPQNTEEKDTLVATALPDVFQRLSKKPEAPKDGSESPLQDWDEVSSTSSFDPSSHNENFFRLDLSASIGNSISFKQLASILERPSPSLSAPLPNLTHLSLSHPSQSASWRGLLAFSKHIPTLTHLSLAYWPAPTLTPNARSAVMSTRFGKDVQYGGTNFYSHTLDNDYREAADVLRRLASRLYSLEYLDLSGCSEWVKALRWTGLENKDPLEIHNEEYVLDLGAKEAVDRESITQGIDWATQFLKLTTLKLSSNMILTPDSTALEIRAFVVNVKEAKATQKVLKWWMSRGNRAGKWVDVVYDDWTVYRDFWKGETGAEERRKRGLLHVLGFRNNTRDGDEDLQLRFLEALETGRLDEGRAGGSRMV